MKKVIPVSIDDLEATAKDSSPTKYGKLTVYWNSVRFTYWYNLTQISKLEAINILNGTLKL